jgi:hypothetical protein
MTWQSGSNITYPIAARHSDQSWHERFKKNAVTLERRAKRYIEDGIDFTLKTKSERARFAALQSGQEVETRTTVTEITDK